MPDSWKDMTAADVQARNARIGVRVGDPRAVGSGQTGKTIVTEGWSGNPPPLPPKTSKYRNVRTKIGAEVFDSQREARYWLVLKAREAAGEIRNLRRQVAFPLYCPVMNDSAADREVSRYLADFTFETGSLDEPFDYQLHVLDAKGKKTQMFVLKAKWLFLQQGITIECV